MKLVMFFIVDISIEEALNEGTKVNGLTGTVSALNVDGKVVNLDVTLNNGATSKVYYDNLVISLPTKLNIAGNSVTAVPEE